MPDLFIVVSAFRPSTRLIRLVGRVAPQFPTLVVDDGSGPDYDDVFDEAARRGASVIRLPENRGIAAALNTGLETGFARGYGSAVTFDQDSLPDLDTIARLLEQRRELESRGERVGLLVPGRFAEVRQARARGAVGDARRVIQSGMLIPASTYTTLGPLREDLFIDLVDTELELRCLATGLRVLSVRDTAIDHELGRMTRLLPLGPRLRVVGVRTMVSTPFRYYYRARNRVALWKQFGRRLFWRMAADTAIDLAYGIVVWASARPRRTFALIVQEGIRDGRAGRMGPMRPALAAAAATIRWSEAGDGP